MRHTENSDGPGMGILMTTKTRTNGDPCFDRTCYICASS